jgi:hypothetical protein
MGLLAVGAVAVAQEGDTQAGPAKTGGAPAAYVAVGPVGLEGQKAEPEPAKAEPAKAEDKKPEPAGYEAAGPAGVVEAVTGRDVAGHTPQWFKDRGIAAGGWMSFGGNVNAGHHQDGYNGPVTFPDRANSFQFNQFNVFVEKQTNKEGKEFDLGFRGEVMLGTDTRFTQAPNMYLGPSMTGLDVGYAPGLGMGLPNTYQLAAPQLYLEGFAPWGNGLTAIVGHFYTPIGYEVVQSNGNFFYSHAYTYQYGEPFTHTGTLLKYPVNKNLTLTAGAVNGWDNWDMRANRWSGITAFNYTTDDAKTTFNVYGISGDSKDTVQSGQNQSLYSLVLTHNFLDKFTYVLQHDHGFLAGNNSINLRPNTAEWYGVNQEFFYEMSSLVKAGLRFEWFRDQNGVRVCGMGVSNNQPGTANPVATAYMPGCAGIGGSYYELSGGFNVSPAKWIKLRPEIRYDFVESKGTAAARTLPFAAGRASDQLIFAVDAVIPF